MSTATKAQFYSKPQTKQSAAFAPSWKDEGVEHCVLYGISWETYEKILKDINDRRMFLTYDHGTLEIMTTSFAHERCKSLIARLLWQYGLEANVPIESCGMVTMKRKKLKQGLEPDECFYVLNAERARDIKEWRETTPAPDLAIEIEISRRLATRQQIYAALGVRELWLDDGKAFRVLHLGRDGRYKQQIASLNFPKLPLKQFERFLRMRGKKTEHEIIREFQHWVRGLNKE
jgi:Uma2 family endonuclease